MIGRWAYPAAFVGAVALSLLLTPAALRLARRFQVLDHPSLHKAQPSPVPYLGGLAIVISFAAVVMIAAVLGPHQGGIGQLGSILGIGVLLSLMGLADDLRGGLNPVLRLAVQVGAGIAMWFAGVSVALLPYDLLNLVLTLAWVVGVTNAFNLLDNMDGLSAGVAVIASAFFFVIAAFEGQFLVASLAAALAGCALGFLRHNFHPARIYMGDAGSLFLGFVLSALGLKLAFPGSAETAFLVPILVLGVAIFDTTLVTITRLANGRSPAAGGRDHTSHRLVFIGIPVPATVGLIYGVAIALGWLAVIVTRIRPFPALLLMGLVLAIAVFLAGLLALVPVYETSRRRRIMIRTVVEHEPAPASQLAEAAAGS